MRGRTGKEREGRQGGEERQRGREGRGGEGVDRTSVCILSLKLICALCMVLFVSLNFLRISHGFMNINL